jgi:hypothetical protein
MIVPVRIRCGVWFIVTSLLAVTFAEAASAGGAFATGTSVSLKSISRDIAATSGRSVGRNLVRSRKLKRKITGANRLGLPVANLACTPQFFSDEEPARAALRVQFLYCYALNPTRAPPLT